MFLGKNRDKYFTIDKVNGFECVSSYPTRCLKSLPSIISNVPTNILLNDTDYYCWLSPVDYDLVELFILLKKPYYLQEMSITMLNNNMSDVTSPFQFDLFTGQYLDKLNLIYHRTTLPRCANKTKLYYSISNNIWKRSKIDNSNAGNNNGSNNGVYDFEIGSTDNNNISRIVHIIFHKNDSNIPFTLGKIELFGVPIKQQNETPLSFIFKLKQQLVKRKSDLFLNTLLNSNDTIHSNDNDDNNNNNSNNNDDNNTKIDKEKEGSEIVNQIYKDKIKEKLKKIEKGEELTFNDTLELEYIRVTHKVTPQERDILLLDLKTEIELFNPDRFIYLRDEKTEVVLRKSSKYKTTRCQECQESLPLLRQKQCCYCYKRYCHICIAQHPTKITEFMWEKPQIVCKRCQANLTEQENLLRKIKKFGDLLKYQQSKKSNNFYQEV